MSVRVATGASRGGRLCLVMVVALAAAAPSPQAPDTARLETLRQQLADRDFEQTERAARDWLAELERSGAGDSLEAAAVLDVLVEVFWQTESVGAESEALARRAVELKRGALGPDAPGLVPSLNNLGIVHELQGRFEQARPLYERALAIQEAALGPDHPEVAFCLINLGILARTTGEYFAARDHFERAVEIRSRHLPPDDPRLGFSLHNLATTQWDLGDLTGARRSLERAVALLEPILGPDDLRLADVIDLLGVVRQKTADLEVALGLYQRALEIRERAVGPDHALVHYSLVNIGSVLVARGRPAEARPHLERALAIAEQSLEPRDKAFGPILHNLADAVALTEGYPAARPIFERAQRLWRDALGEDHPGVAWTGHLEAGFLIQAGDYAEAEKLLRHAVRIWEHSVGPEHPQLAGALGDLGWTLAASGRPAEALRTALRAAEVGRRHARLTVRGLPERQALRYAAQGLAPLDLAVELAAQQPAAGAADQAWDAVIRSRALVLDEVAARIRLASGDPDARAIADELAEARERLATLFVRSQGDAAGELIPALRQARAEKERIERELAEKSVVFREGMQRELIGLAAVRASLPPGAALLAYLRCAPRGAPPSYVAFSLAADRELRLTPLGDASRIESLVTRWRDRIRLEAERPGRDPLGSELATASIGAALRRAIWDPVEEQLGETERVFVVPDGPLHLVNLAALPARDGRYLVESRRLFALSTERDLVSGERPATGRGLLALGDPSFGSVVARGRLAEAAPEPARARGACLFLEPFERLPASGREVRQIAAAWAGQSQRGALEYGSPLALLGDEASEAALKREAPGRRILHLATHGYFLGGECAAEAAQAGASTSPLLRSGLVLAGVNSDPGDDATQDGVLTAEEIAALNLEGVEWAVLSACETGLGEIRAGEGVFGLRRAFQLAGARTVVMSLWPVDDAATVRFMRALYRSRFVAGATTADALHQATLSELRRRRRGGAGAHPFYWAPFVAVGDWR